MGSKLDSLTTMTEGAIGDYYDRTDEHNSKLLDESYQFAWREKDNLTTRYNSGMFNLIDHIYSDIYDKDVKDSWRTNDNVELVQKYLNDIGSASLDQDGMYGKETQNAMKDYLYEFRLIICKKTSWLCLYICRHC